MPEKTSVPIFYDQKQKRWVYIKLTSLLSGLLVFVVSSVTVVSLINNPNLPNLNLYEATKSKLFPPPKPKNQSLSYKERVFQKTKARLNAHLTGKVPLAPTAATADKAGNSQLVGFLVNWDDASFSSLKQNINFLDKLIPEWVHLASASGEIALDKPDLQDAIIKYVEQKKPNLKIIPLINNFNSATQNWDNTTLSLMLKSEPARRQTINNLLDYVKKNNLVAFINELYSTFSPLGLEVSQDVPLNNYSFDYAGLARSTDYLVAMSYDEHWTESSPGPIASQDWYTSSLEKLLKVVPPEKLIIALGNYGYDWTENIKPATYLSFQEAIQTAQESEGDINLDDSSLNPTFSYYSDPKTLHHVWFLDGVTTFNEVQAGKQFAPLGFALWRLGSEDPSIWKFLGSHSNLDAKIAASLSEVPYGYNIDYKGKGEILKIATEPNVGQRDIEFDTDLNLISTEHVTKYPNPYIVERLGGLDPKKIALTFDDGPDPDYTPKILDILKKYNVPATFFVVGLNADTNSDIVQREIKEGSEIGNHTFSHPNITMISRSQFRLEINATERLFESRLGIHSLLFRPPYAEDVEPETVDQIKPLMFTSRLGYYVIGMKIDPGDWNKPGVDEIVNRTVNGAATGIGNVVLLHDSGGDRSQTIEALPRIIEGLEQKGFKLVTISDLMGVSKDRVIPSLTAKERLVAVFNDLVFRFMDFGSKIITFLFALGIYLGIARLIFIGTLAVIQKKKNKFVDSAGFNPSVSAIVPAYNEEGVITKTIDALLASSYKNLEIIFVDDGSTDNTLDTVTKKFWNNPRIEILSKVNSGKSETLNLGINTSRADLVVIQDADTVIKPDAIGKMVAHFVNPAVGAVAGNAKVGNRINLLTRMQALEYITSQNLDRRAFDLLNCITVVPGAIGAWRRELVIKEGGLKNDTLAEDADLTLKIIRAGYVVNYEEDAVALTEAPDNIKAFLKQRFRWMFGTWQVAWKHKDVIFRPKYKSLGFVALPNLLIFQILFPFISPIMDLVMLGTLVLTYWQIQQHPLEGASSNLIPILFYYLLFLTVDYLTSALAFILERKEDWKLLVVLFFQRLFYRQFIYFVAIKSVVAVLKGGLVGWGKFERKGMV